MSGKNINLKIYLILKRVKVYLRIKFLQKKVNTLQYYMENYIQLIMNLLKILLVLQIMMKVFYQKNMIF